MHIGDIHFPFFFPDNGLLFQALLSAAFPRGMISITKDAEPSRTTKQLRLHFEDENSLQAKKENL